MGMMMINDRVEMIAKATEYAQEHAGYSYSSDTLESIIEAGIDGIADGTMIYDNGMEKLVRNGNSIDTVSRSGNVLRSTELNDDAAEQIVIMYAVTASKISSGNGLR